MAKKTTYELALEIGGKIKSSLEKSVGKVNQKLDSIQSTAKKVAGAVGAAFATIKISEFFADCTQAAIEFESSMADVAKVVDGLKDENGNLTESYYQMSDSLIEMSKNIPMTTNELASIMAAAGTAGIATEDLERFTETAAKMGVAFDSTADQAGEWMAIWRTALGLTQDEVEVLGDQINYLGNTSSENALKLSEIVTNIGSLAKISGVSGSELAALGAATTGINADVAATGLKNMFVAMGAGASATKKQTEVLKQLGFTATDVAERMQTDSQGMILDLLGAINKLPAAEQEAAISNYFGKESLSTVAVLAGNLDNLKDQFDKIGDATAYAGSMQAEYATRAATTENSVQLLKNTVQALKIQIGNMLLPVVASGLKMLSSGISVIEMFTGKAEGKFKKVTKTVSLFAECITGTFDNIASGKGVMQSFEESLKATFGVEVPEEFKKAIEKIKNEAVFLKNTAVTAFQNLKNKISENKPEIDKLVLVASDLKNKLFEAFEKAKPTIVFIATVALPAVIGAIMKVIGAAATVYQKLDEWGLLIPIITGIAGAIAAVKMVKFAKDTINTVKATKALVTVFLAQKKAMIANLALKIKDKAETAYLYALYAKDAIVKGVSTAATWAQTAAMTAWNAICTVGTAVTTALGAAFTFLTSPIGLVILAIAAVVAIGVLLYKNWDTVKEKASQLGDWIVGVFNNLKEKASAAIQAFADKFPAAFAFISAIFESWKQTVSNVISGVKQVFQGIIQFFTGVFTGDWQKALEGLKNIFSGAFQALSSLAMAPLNALKGVVTGAFNAIDTATGGKLTEMKNKASETWNSIKQTAGTVLSAAKTTIDEKLSNIKTAYESHGGGIKGVAAAVMEGVKGYYTAGYSFLNNLTGGKLEEMRSKFSEKLSSIKTNVSSGFEAVKSTMGNVMSQAVTSVTGNLSAMKTAYTTAGGGIKGIVSATMTGVRSTASTVMSAVNTLTGGKLEAIKNSFSTKLGEAYTTVTTKFESIRSGISTKIEAAKTTVQNGLNAIKNFFSGLSLKLPDIKLPHFSITGSFSLDPPSIPKIGISWYKNGGILTGPTIFGASGGNLLGGGEAGKEAVLPLSELWSNMRSVIADVMNAQPNAALDMFGKIRQLVGGQTVGQTGETVTRELYNSVSTNNNTVNRNKEVDSSDNSSKFIYSPQVTIQGNADKKDVESALEMSQAKFNQMMAEYQRQKGRTSFA